MYIIGALILFINSVRSDSEFKIKEMIKNKLHFHPSKVLKLTNVLKYKLIISDEQFDFNVAIEQMQSYIKVKDAIQIGPLIRYSRTFMNDTGELDIEIVMMLQCNNFIHNVEAPYSIESVIRVPDAFAGT